jgi:hypothetical protein
MQHSSLRKPHSQPEINSSAIPGSHDIRATLWSACLKILAAACGVV